jgi:hypothetical protein
LPSKLLQVESLFRFVCIYTGRGKYWIIDEEDKVDTCGVIGVDAASDEEDKVNTCGALTSETLAKYCAAYLSCKHINDQLYDTWKMYKTKCNKTNASKYLSVHQLVDGLHPLPQETKVQSRIITN